MRDEAAAQRLGHPRFGWVKHSLDDCWELKRGDLRVRVWTVFAMYADCQWIAMRVPEELPPFVVTDEQLDSGDEMGDGAVGKAMEAAAAALDRLRRGPDGVRGPTDGSSDGGAE